MKTKPSHNELMTLAEALADAIGDELFETVSDDGPFGYCLGCHDLADSVEPDAEFYRCACCGEYLVFGAQEILLYLA